MLKLKLQNFGHLMQTANSLEKTERKREEKWAKAHEMVGWHDWLKVYEFEQALGDGEGQGILESCSPCGRKVLDNT